MAAFASRFYPGPTTEQHRADIDKTTKAFAHNFPALALELRNGETPMRVLPGGREVHPFHAGPLLVAYMRAFAARVSMALHCEATGGMVPVGGAVFADWYPNGRAFDDDLPAEFLRVLGPERTLGRGRRTAAGQFHYSSIHSNEHGVHGYWATFRGSFAVLGFVSHDAGELARAREEDLYRPSFLHRSPCDHMTWPERLPDAYPERTVAWHHSNRAIQ